MAKKKKCHGISLSAKDSNVPDLSSNLNQMEPAMQCKSFKIYARSLYTVFISFYSSSYNKQYNQMSLYSQSFR